MIRALRLLLGAPSRQRMRWARRHRLVWVASALVLALGALMLWPLSARFLGADEIIVVAVGDMACDPTDPDMQRATRETGDRCRQRDVSDLAVAADPDVLLALGDLQHEVPTEEAYRTVYGPSYGRLRDRTVPVFGNQEYKAPEASSFLTYFGDLVRDPRGYWSQEIGRWHLVVLNSNCSIVTGGCGPGSPQQTWLAADLAANGRRCVIAAWHHPRWSTGIAGPDDRTAALYRTLYEHRVDLVLSGHEAHYQRFGPLNDAGRADELRGLRQFVVGTGGQAHYRPEEPAVPGSPVAAYTDYDHHGVLVLNLRSESYSWWFRPLEAGRERVDEGSARCL
ncbi:MAG TPA: metallophosphoesterase [Actinoplanes sp.]|nr:metallophosphoesterase [Actinoplanes sp.]